ncbi:hematopoietic lineage cell-specific protein isoform X2 [Megalops cyprinoides]|uniref:hematopoietic lineage cell-specific protein isoform X2 n=1 Tax=Megalops cyprinoides TaxID=118141 RepID=UPI0018646048|nr:hematopoietic lineage cell-specific protein isoform X2 [Megalops cyprinoides]
MWKSVVGHNVSMKVASEGDDWETDPDFENDVSEQEQRWGAKTIEGSGRKEHISVAELRQNVSKEHEVVKKKEMEQAPKASYGYGGKFGVEKDRMDKVAVGHAYVAQVEQHSSQTDAARGFGGKFGVQKDRVDKSAMGFEYKGDVEQHSSQKDYSKGFGGKYGVEKEKVDKAALGYDYKGETEKHESQKDYSKGFGGKYGVEKEKVDKAALGYDYKGETEKHESQKDYAKGFGGRYGVQTDRVDKSAASFSDMESPSSAYERTQPLEASSSGAGNLKARFENMAQASNEENRKRADEERARRQAREKREQEEARRRQEEQSGREVEEEQPPPLPATRRAPEVPRELPETPREEPVPIAQEEEEPEYEEPPDLPDRPQDLLEEEADLDQGQQNEEAADWGADPDQGIEAPPAPAVDNDYEDLSSGICATALYDYQGEGDDEISFVPDDIITNIEMIDEGWWRGHCRGHFGLFPATFVQLMQGEP